MEPSIPTMHADTTILKEIKKQAKANKAMVIGMSKQEEHVGPAAA